MEIQVDYHGSDVDLKIVLVWVLLFHVGDKPKTRCVKCVPKCASVHVAPSNIVYYCTDIDPQGKVN